MCMLSLMHIIMSRDWRLLAVMGAPGLHVSCVSVLQSLVDDLGAELAYVTNA